MIPIPAHAHIEHQLTGTANFGPHKGDRFTFTIWRGQASDGYKTGYERRPIRIIDITFHGDKKATYRRRYSGRRSAATAGARSASKREGDHAMTDTELLRRLMFNFISQHGSIDAMELARAYNAHSGQLPIHWHECAYYLDHLLVSGVLRRSTIRPPRDRFTVYELARPPAQAETWDQHLANRAERG